MFKIAVVEDEEDAYEVLATLVDRYCKENSQEYCISHFKTGFEFLEKFHQNFNIVFMDIDMPHINGIETSRQLRQMDNEVALVFVTNLSKLAIKGYEVDASSFLVKPINYYVLENCLKKISKKIQQEERDFLLLSVDDSIIKIKIGEILFIEVMDHFSVFHLLDQRVIKIRSTLNSIEERLSGYGFSRCSNSYLINLKYIETIEGDMVYIGSERITITRTKKKQFMLDFTEYYGNR